MHPKFNKFVAAGQPQLKFKKQCLKPKNILFQNDTLQIACKVVPFYDFYTSRNYLQIQMFMGNKMNKKINNFSLHFKATHNLEVYVEQKSSIIPESAQFKQRVLIECNSFEQEILLLMDFHSDVLTLKSVLLPVTLYSFLAVKPQLISSLPLTTSYAQLSDVLSSRYEYIEQIEVTVNVGIFKKGLLKELNKYFQNFTTHSQNLIVGQFTLKDLTDEYTLAIVISDDIKMKVVLCGNYYDYFEVILTNLRFLLV